MKTEMIYTRRTRALANAAVLGAIFLVWRLVAGQPAIVIVGALLVLAPGIVYYGHFLASQMCSNCREPIFHLPSDYLSLQVAALFAPLHIPRKCPNCGRVTSW